VRVQQHTWRFSEKRSRRQKKKNSKIKEHELHDDVKKKK
jgi:hypothetical protein